MRNLEQSEKTARENQTLIDFWGKVFSLSEAQRAQLENQPGEAWKELAPSQKLFHAASFLGRRKRVLDFGCGNAWAGIIAAKSGCPHVTAVDAAPGAVQAARLFVKQFGVSDCVHVDCAPPNWLRGVPTGTYDGLFCSNVLDVIPPETAEAILRELARVVTRDAAVIIGLNYYLSPEAAAARGMDLADGNRLYIDGVLRLVSRTDEEWAGIFSPWYTVERLEYFAWPGEEKELRRLFWLRKREENE